MSSSTALDSVSGQALLDRIFEEKPEFHKGETEVQRSVELSESLLPTEAAARLLNTDSAFYGVSRDIADYLVQVVEPHWKTLEIGLGVSTLSFAIKGSTHICVTPAKNEIEAINAYAKSSLNLSLAKISFAAESSDTYLPRCSHTDLDLVLIDGKHAFPFPIIDWFYTAERLKKGGLMLIDDAQMKSVSILKDFMDSDTRWETLNIGSTKTYAYKKLTDNVHDVAWHMQPYVFEDLPKSAYMRPSFSYRAIRKLKRMLFG